MIAINETKFGAALGTVLNEVGKSPEMMNKLFNKYLDYTDKAEKISPILHPIDKMKYDSAAKKAISLAGSISSRTHDRPLAPNEQLSFNMKNARKYGDKQHPERIINRIKNEVKDKIGGKKA